ncbi:biotin/lipoyl-binding protein [Actinomadura sp. LD22]|uniref:Biotin/lipoyl-binding protein n=1 Tax=Actinomadura physcomitrii TaxID=2650748 RepID=A0A6I4MIZ8_9ACTN|nr:lipoyl domain-containing protein [Actinomadura physcomitrii]MWA04870.1 biotin/lipoyl-binding protein [Actinomadura physcomitrii]
MTEQIRIPKLGVSVTEATITEWLVADGDQVEAGAVLYVIATDKVENEIESPATGRIRLLAEEDTTHPVGTVIAEITTG